MKTLLAGTSYINTELKEWLFHQWVNLSKKLNPTVDLLIVDSDSPIKSSFKEFSEINIFSFPDNLGHLQSTGIDGWGRATMKALDFAIDQNYDYVATIDTDVIFTRKLLPIFSFMEKNRIKAASTRGPPYSWLEGIFFFSVPWLKTHNLIQKYSWETMRSGIFPEHKMEQIIGPYLYDLKLIGRRNDDTLITSQNLFSVFPFGCDWLTHCNNKEVYLKLIEKIK